MFKQPPQERSRGVNDILRDLQANSRQVLKQNWVEVPSLLQDAQHSNVVNTGRSEPTLQVHPPNRRASQQQQHQMERPPALRPQILLQQQRQQTLASHPVTQQRPIALPQQVKASRQPSVPSDGLLAKLPKQPIPVVVPPTATTGSVVKTNTLAAKETLGEGTKSTPLINKVPNAYTPEVVANSSHKPKALVVNNSPVGTPSASTSTVSSALKTPPCAIAARTPPQAVAKTPVVAPAVPRKVATKRQYVIEDLGEEEEDEEEEEEEEDEEEEDEEEEYDDITLAEELDMMERSITKRVTSSSEDILCKIGRLESIMRGLTDDVKMRLHVVETTCKNVERQNMIIVRLLEEMMSQEAGIAESEDDYDPLFEQKINELMKGQKIVNKGNSESTMSVTVYNSETGAYETIEERNRKKGSSPKKYERQEERAPWNSEKDEDKGVMAEEDDDEGGLSLAKISANLKKKRGAHQKTQEGAQGKADSTISTPSSSGETSPTHTNLTNGLSLIEECLEKYKRGYGSAPDSPPSLLSPSPSPSIERDLENALSGVSNELFPHVAEGENVWSGAPLPSYITTLMNSTIASPTSSILGTIKTLGDGQCEETVVESKTSTVTGEDNVSTHHDLEETSAPTSTLSPSSAKKDVVLVQDPSSDAQKTVLKEKEQSARLMISIGGKDISGATLEEVFQNALAATTIAVLRSTAKSLDMSTAGTKPEVARRVVERLLTASGDK